MARLSKSQYYYKIRKDDSVVMEALITMANQHPAMDLESYMHISDAVVKPGITGGFIEYISY